MDKKVCIYILHQLDLILNAIDIMNISDGCAGVVERHVLNIKTKLFCDLFEEVEND